MISFICLEAPSHCLNQRWQMSAHYNCARWLWKSPWCHQTYRPIICVIYDTQPIWNYITGRLGGIGAAHAIGTIERGKLYKNHGKHLITLDAQIFTTLGKIDMFLHFIPSLHINLYHVVTELFQFNCKYHGCWCPGSLCHQGISNDDIDYVE